MDVKIQPKCPRVVEVLAWLISRVIGASALRLRVRVYSSRARADVRCSLRVASCSSGKIQIKTEAALVLAHIYMAHDTDAS